MRNDETDVRKSSIASRRADVAVPNRRRGDRARARARGGLLRARVDRRGRTSAPRRDDLRSARERAFLPARGWEVSAPVRDPRPEEKMPFAREKPVANSGVTDGRVPNGGDRPRHLASKASGLGSRASVRAGRGRHVLCVTRRTGATAENADIGRRLRGASGRLRGTRAWKTAR